LEKQKHLQVGLKTLGSRISNPNREFFRGYNVSFVHASEDAFSLAAMDEETTNETVF